MPPLLYRGGPVMHAVTTHVIAWVPASATAFPGYYVSGYETYLGDLAHDVGSGTNVSSVAAQYVDANGPALSSLSNAAAITDTDGYPASGCDATGASACLTEDQIKAELRNVITNDALVANTDQSYIVLLPQNVNTCTDSSSSSCESNAFCGYHDVLNVGSATTTFSLLPYPESSFASCYDGSSYPSGTPTDLGTLDSIGTHELIESVTDPATGSGYLDVNGWEIGDECAYDYGNPLVVGGDYNQVDNTHDYWIQQMWSNQDNNCVQGVATTATASVTHSPTTATRFAPTDFATALAHDGSATPAVYAWSYMDPNGKLQSGVSSAASPQLNLTTGGPTTVWVQITDSNGGTITGVTDLDVLGNKPTASFVDSSATPVATPHNNVSFVSTSTSDSTEHITSASWNFGDGATGSGLSVSHAYASAGTYTVTLTATQTDGQTAQTSQVVTVDNPPSSAFSWGSNPTAGQALAFSSGGSTAGSGSITSYSWDFGDGGTSTAQNPTYTYSAGGNFTVTLSVTQADGLTASIQHTVTVAAAQPVRPSRSSLNQGLVPPGKATRITTLLKKGQATSVVSANVAGRITITWYATVKHHRIVVARGSASVQAGAVSHVVVRLTAAGRSLLRRSRRLRVTISGIYTAGGTRVTSKKTITLRR